MRKELGRLVWPGMAGSKVSKLVKLAGAIPGRVRQTGAARAGTNVAVPVTWKVGMPTKPGTTLGSIVHDVASML
jgi:hypothetical protein